MKLDGEHIFPGPQQAVWELVRDPEALAKALPGAEALTKLSENEYEGTMNVRIGPISGAFSGKVVISEETPPTGCTLTAEGKGPQGFAKGTGRIQLIEQADGTTLMRYEGDVQIGGKLASVGQRSLDTVSRSLIRQGLLALDQVLATRLAAEAAGQPEVAYTKPTEVEFATAVARDVAKDVAAGVKSSMELKMILFIVPVVIALFFMALIASRCSG